MSEMTNEERARGWAEWCATRPPAVRAVAERFQPWREYQFKKSKRLCFIYSYEEPFDGSPVTLKVDQPDMFIPDLCDRVFGVDPDDIEPATAECVRPITWPRKAG